MAPEFPHLCVLWATDGSDEARSATALMRRLILPSASRLVVLNVAPHSVLSGARPDPAFLLKAGAAAKRNALLEGEDVAQGEATRLDPPSGVQVEAISCWGNPIEEVLKAARSRSADVIVMGAKGHSNLGLLLVGSVSQGVVQNATKPVLVARPGAGETDSHDIVVGYQGSPAARKAVAFLERLQLPDGARIHLVDVIEPFEVPAGTPATFRKRAREAAHELHEHRSQDAHRRLEVLSDHLRAAGHRVDAEVVTGEPGPELDAIARQHNAALIVVGSRRPDPGRHFLIGPTAEKLVRHSQTSVLVVR